MICNSASFLKFNCHRFNNVNQKKCCVCFYFSFFRCQLVNKDLNIHWCVPDKMFSLFNVDTEKDNDNSFLFTSKYFVNDIKSSLDAEYSSIVTVIVTTIIKSKQKSRPRVVKCNHCNQLLCLLYVATCLNFLQYQKRTGENQY